MAGEIDINTVAKAYARWAPVYDLVFGAVFDAGRKATIAAAERIGGRRLYARNRTRTLLTHSAPALRAVSGRYFQTPLRNAPASPRSPRLPAVPAVSRS